MQRRARLHVRGCIQAQQCHTSHCPTGATAPDRWRQRAIVVSDKSLRVASFHKETVKALAELIAAAGTGDALGWD